MARIYLAISLIFIASTWAAAQPAGLDGVTYKSGFSSIMKLGKDIYTFLKPAQKNAVSASPVEITDDMIPYAKLLYYPDETQTYRGVAISAGFIDLVNRVAHAKAIDLSQKGYLSRYVELLSKETGETELQALPNDTNPAYWTEDMLNEQLSNFNSIVGLVVGVKLAHHYLGHYEKYKDRLQDASGKPVPISNLLTPKEWEEAFSSGARNALDAGCTVEGVVSFFEAFDKMKTRPPWAAYFMPDTAKFTKLRKDLERIQKKFFAGED